VKAARYHSPALLANEHRLEWGPCIHWLSTSDTPYSPDSSVGSTVSRGLPLFVCGTMGELSGPNTSALLSTEWSGRTFLAQFEGLALSFPFPSHAYNENNFSLLQIELCLRSLADPMSVSSLFSPLLACQRFLDRSLNGFGNVIARLGTFTQRASCQSGFFISPFSRVHIQPVRPRPVLSTPMKLSSAGQASVFPSPPTQFVDMGSDLFSLFQSSSRRTFFYGRKLSRTHFFSPVVHRLSLFSLPLSGLRAGGQRPFPL